MWVLLHRGSSQRAGLLLFVIGLSFLLIAEFIGLIKHRERRENKRDWKKPLTPTLPPSLVPQAPDKHGGDSETYFGLFGQLKF